MAAAWPGLTLPPSAHVGYYLVDEGRAMLDARLGYRPSLKVRLACAAQRHPAAFYLGFNRCADTVGAGRNHPIRRRPEWLGVSGISGRLLVVLPALAAAVAVVDWVVTLVVPPRILSKLDLSGKEGADGIPDACRTMVVVPAMLSSGQVVASLLQQIEQHYLRNPPPQPLLRTSDRLRMMPQSSICRGDAALVEQVRSGIDRLNAQYSGESGGESGASGGPFCLFHRERRWNEQEGRWIGWSANGENSTS